MSVDFVNTKCLTILDIIISNLCYFCVSSCNCNNISSFCILKLLVYHNTLNKAVRKLNLCEILFE